MLRDILTNKGVLAGLVLVVLVVAFSLLYSWHVERSIREDEARTERFLQHYENKQMARTGGKTPTPWRNRAKRALAWRGMARHATPTPIRKR